MSFFIKRIEKIDISQIKFLDWHCRSTNPFRPTAELFVSIFHSFEAGIANAISSFKWMKNNVIFEKNKHLLITLFD